MTTATGRSAGFTLGLAVFVLWLWPAAVGQAQIELFPLNPQEQILEPGMGKEMVQSASAQLGDGAVVFEFGLRDVDPLANDNSNVFIDSIEIHNLGSAPCEDFAQLGVIDSSDNFVGLNPGDNKPVDMSSCSPGGGPITWGVEILLPSPIEIPDDTQTATFKVALRTADTDTLGAGSQNHTIRLRVILHFRENVGSPPEEANFTASITDPAPDRVWNGGINALNPITFSPRLIPLSLPGQLQSGPVAAFQVCDRPNLKNRNSRDLRDANDHPLRITELLLRQGPLGNARSSDIQSFRLFVDGSEHGTLSTLTSDFDRGGAGLSWEVNVDIPDDGCRDFKIWAVTAQGAMVGRTIHLSVKLFADEPAGFPIYAGVAPVYQADEVVMIGRGVLRIRTMAISGIRSRVPLEVLGLPTGLYMLKLCDDKGRGGILFDPSVIQIDGVDPAGAYRVQTDSLRIDNRAGRICFTLELQDEEPARGMDQPEPVAFLIVSARDNSQFGKESLLLLQPARIEDATGPNIIAQTLIVSGRVTLTLKGDLDGDGRPTVRDALFLALELLNGCPNLDDEMKFAADVVISPGAPRESDPSLVPKCDPPRPDLDSADVAAIARLAITFGFDEITPASAVVPLHVRSLSVFPSTIRGRYTLRVEGQGIAAVELQIYDLMGRPRFAGRARGDTLAFALRDAQGRPLANGVYLYVVKVRGVDGRVWHSEVKKLVVLR